MHRHRIAQWLAVAAVGFAASSSVKADVIANLMTAGSDVTLNDNAFITTTNIQSQGTGIMSPFLRIQNNGLERGYNADGGYTLDQKAGPWTHSLFTTQLVPITLSGKVGTYYQFELGLNQTKDQPLLSLTQFRLYQGNTAFPTGDPEAGTGSFANPGGAETLLYNLSNPTNGKVQVDMSYSINSSGQGAADVFFNIPTNLLQGLSFAPNTFITLYASFGRDDNSNGKNGKDDGSSPFQADDGPEDWSTLINPNVPPPITNPVPAPPALVLGLVGAAGLFGKRAWARKRTPELA
jgi:hypothetical protein